MHMPKGYQSKSKILLLNKTLYSLRISSLLWQKEFTKTLQEIGYTQVPHEPCCYIRNGVLIFFYVDNIIIAYQKRLQAAVNKLTQQLSQHYNISSSKPAQWFLGMKIARNKSDQKIWLSQKAYIKKIAKLATKKTAYPVPMGAEELQPRKSMAAPSEIQAYQKKIELLLFAAVFTRPDIAFATFRLAKFLTNPSHKHH
jgi:hypothetical protein